MIVAVFACVCAVALAGCIAVYARTLGHQLAAVPACTHTGALPVHTLYGDRELVAWLCPDCDRQLAVS